MKQAQIYLGLRPPSLLGCHRGAMLVCSAVLAAVFRSRLAKFSRRSSTRGPDRQSGTARDTDDDLTAIGTDFKADEEKLGETLIRGCFKKA